MEYDKIETGTGGEAMNTDTTLAKNLGVADEKAGYDAACKRLLSEKIILAWIMKNCLEEYRDCDADEIARKYIEGTPQVGEVAVALDESNYASMIQGAGNEDTSLTEGTVTYDIPSCNYFRPRYLRTLFL